MATLLRLLVILIGRPPVHDGSVVEDLNLTAFHPEVMTMCGVGEEVVQDLDRLRTRVVEHMAGLLVAAPYHPRIEPDSEPPVLNREDWIPVVGVRCLILLLVAIIRLI